MVRPEITSEPKPERLPPYVSYKTWSRLLNGLVNFLPDVIDSSVYSELRFSGSDTKKLRSALRYLNLIDEDGVPSKTLYALVQSYRGEGEPKAQVLRRIIQEAYPLLSDGSFSLATGTWKQLTDKFEALGVTSEVQRQCISFLLHIATEAEEQISPHLGSRVKSGLGRPSVVRKSRQRQQKEQWHREAARQAPPAEVSLGISWIGLLEELFLDDFPGFDSTWPDDVKIKWLFRELTKRARRGSAAGPV